jgi:F-type H+-transporting ATPase subunit b
MSILPEPRVLILQALGFLTVLLILRKFLFKAAGDLFAARQRDVEVFYSAAEDDRKAAEELKAEYEKHLAEIDAEMRAKITEAAKEGQTLREEIVAEAREKADQVLARAEEEIGREKDKAILEIKTRVADLAVGAAGKLIEERLDDAKHRQLVDNYIDELEGVSK